MSATTGRGAVDEMIDVCLGSATYQRELLRERRISARELLEQHLALTDALNPQVNAIVTQTIELARECADAADRSLARGDGGPLTGLPVAYKDSTPTRGIRTTFGSALFADHVPEADAIWVERMRAAGAVTVGKTNLPEFAAGSQTYNALFGATRNPFDPTRTCGGSSGGAAAALATGMVALADGTDMGGSLRNPASFCNVVGLRPSPGVVPAWPSPSLWEPLSVPGPMGRTVADVALLLSVMQGPDARAPLSGAAGRSAPERALEQDHRGVRIAWSRTLGGLPVDPRVTEVLERGRPAFEQIGCVVEAVEPDFTGADEAFETWRAFLFELNLGEAYDEHRDALNEDIRWNIEQGRRMTVGTFAAAERARVAVSARIRDLLSSFDFLVAPVSQVPPFDVGLRYPTQVGDTTFGSYIEWMRSCSRVSITGLPALSVPFGFTDDGLPVGIQLIGPMYADWRVLALGHALEAATGFGRRRPEMVTALASGTSTSRDDSAADGVSPRSA
jgi:amidase